jgi:hypothetical protein
MKAHVEHRSALVRHKKNNICFVKKAIMEPFQAVTTDVIAMVAVSLMATTH